MASLPAKGFRTVAVDTQIPWVADAQILAFRGREFHLLPATDNAASMVRVRTTEDFTQADADRLILEFLSALAWAEQAGAAATVGNWCTAPLDVGKGPVGAIGHGHFDYLPDPPHPKAKLALALYREGLSANLIPYRFLGFFKVINVFRNRGAEQKQWIRDHLKYLREKKAVKRLAVIQTKEPDVAAYLYQSGRCAVAHAFDARTVVNPDDPADLIRLHEDLPVIRELARVAIERELGVRSKQNSE